MALQTRGSSKQIREYIIKERIGVGSYGMIYKVITKNSKQLFVLKQIPFLSSDNKEEIEEVKNEASILSQFNSRFIVKYYDSFEENKSLNIVMEYCEGGDLSSYLSTMKKYTKTLNENQIWKFFIQMSLGLDYIHKRKILHRDLKTMNIFLTKDLDIKIGDLGVAKRLQNTAHAYTFIGTPFYLSPEICEEKPYDEKSDVWALGCILYEMSTFKHPFNASNQAALFIKILNGTYEPIVNKYSKDLKKMIDMLLEKNYFKRPTIRQVIETPLFLSKAKALGMLDIVIETLSFFARNNGNSNNKIKMIKVSSVHKVKEGNKDKEKDKNTNSNSNNNKGRQKKRKRSIKGNSLPQSEQESQSGCNKVTCSNSYSNNYNNNNTKDSFKGNVNKPQLSSDQVIKKQLLMIEKKKISKPPNQCPNGNNNIGNGNDNNNQHKSKQIHIKNPITSIMQNNNGGIMSKLNQISNDYNQIKEIDYNNMVSSRKKVKSNQQLNSHNDITNSKRKRVVAQEQEPEQEQDEAKREVEIKEESKQALDCISINNLLDKNNKLKKKKLINLNQLNSVFVSNLFNQAKENQKNHISKMKLSKEISSDIYQFAKELDKKTLKLASIQTIKKSKTNDRIQCVPLFKNINEDQNSFRVVEADHINKVKTIDDNSIEAVEVNDTMEYNNNEDEYNNNGHVNNNNDQEGADDEETNYEDDEVDENEESETVSIIRSSDYLRRQERDLVKEYNERVESLKHFKTKYNYYLNGIMKYSGLIDCQYFFNLYKQLENNENIDEKTNKIIEYIHKTIPEKEAEFTKLFHNFIVYEVKFRENEKEIKEWKMPE